jgi:LmbE family N-acetylglucosaminyl deacetylase
VINLQVPAGALTVLALGAPPDDVEIGCGGTLLTLASTRKVRAHVVVRTGTAQRAVEATGAAHRFLAGAEVTVHTHGLPDGRLPAHWDEVTTLLEEHAVDVRPDLVLAARRGDAH